MRQRHQINIRSSIAVGFDELQRAVNLDDLSHAEAKISAIPSHEIQFSELKYETGIVSGWLLGRNAR